MHTKHTQKKERKLQFEKRKHVLLKIKEPQQEDYTLLVYNCKAMHDTQMHVCIYNTRSDCTSDNDFRESSALVLTKEPVLSTKQSRHRKTAVCSKMFFNLIFSQSHI